MSNQGKICVLVNDAQEAKRFCDSLTAWVSTHPSLKNLELAWHPVPFGRYRGPVVVYGVCDGVTPENVTLFLKEHKTPGIHLFVVNSTYGDNWEEVV